MAEEQNLQSKILRFLRYQKIYTIRIVSASSSGSPDVVACLKGVFIAIEVKSSSGTASYLQSYHSEKIFESGGIYVIVRPKMFDEFCKKITEAKRSCSRKDMSHDDVIVLLKSLFERFA